MRIRRGTLIAFVFLLFGTFAIACGGTNPGTTDGNGTADMMQSSSGDGGGLPVGAACTDNSECESMLCTKTSYDRKPGPICTYMCDPNNPNPLCPMGCNPKGYCRVQ